MPAEWQESALRAMSRWGLVLAVVIGLLLLSVVPLRIAHLGELRPAFILMAVYYWSILRPAPLVGVFILGLILDLLSAYPLGMSALVLVVAQLLASSQRKFLLGQSFLVIWAGFALVALGAGLAQWLIFSIFEASWVVARPMLISTLLSALLFPLVVVPLALVHRILAEPAPLA